MITNPVVGMRVRCCHFALSVNNQLGTIYRVKQSHYYRWFIWIQWDSGALNFGHYYDEPWYIGYFELVDPISPEEEAKILDQQNRLAHAMKYL